MDLRRIAAIVALLCTALLPATAGAQETQPLDLELRLPDPAWSPERTAGALSTLTTPDGLIGPLVPAGDPVRADVLRAVRATGFVGGVARTSGAAPGRTAVRAWAVRVAEPTDAAGLRSTIRRALTARAGTAGLAAAPVAGVAGSILLDRTATDGSRLMLVMFPVGPWLYGIEAGGATPDAAELGELARRLAVRQPEQAGVVATPLEVTDALTAELATARASARGHDTAVQPRVGSVQAGRHTGRDIAIATFGSGTEPEVFIRDAAGAWRWSGDVGGPGCPRLPAEVRTLWGLDPTCPAQTSAVAAAGGGTLAHDDSPLHGVGMWVWEVHRSGGTAGIIDRARRSGLRTIYVKSGDGVHYWRQFNSALPALRRAGLKVCGWQYIRGRAPVREARIAARAIARGADCFVVNAEVEFERMGIGAGSRAQRTARTYMTELRRLAGRRVPIGFTSFAYPDFHARFPYTAFLTGPHAADVNMPQIYWGAFGVRVDEAVQRTARWNSIYGVPLAPIGGTYMRERPADLLRFRCLAAGHGWAGVSYWSFQHTRAPQWPSVSNRRACTTPAPAPREYPELRPGRRGDQVLLAQERLRAWGYPVGRDAVYGPRTRTAVRTFQRDRGLQQSGIVTATTWALLLAPPPV